jgi:DnaJ-class molecular chaperone
MITADKIHALKEIRNLIDGRISELESLCPVCDGRGRLFTRLKHEGGKDTLLDCYRCKGTGRKEAQHA